MLEVCFAEIKGDLEEIVRYLQLCFRGIKASFVVFGARAFSVDKGHIIVA